MRSVMLLFLVTMMSFAQSDDVITLRSVADLHPIAQATFDEEITALAWSPDSQQVALASSVGLQIFDWQTSLDEPVLSIDGPEADYPFQCIDWVGNLITASCLRGSSSVMVWDAETGEQVAILEGGEAASYRTISMIHFSPDGQFLVVVNTLEVSIHVWETGTLQELGILKRGDNFPRTIAFSPDSSSLVVGYTSRELTRWNLEELRPEWSVKPAQIPMSIALSPDDNYIALVYESMTDADKLYLLDASIGDQLREITVPGIINYPTYSPNGHLLVVDAWNRLLFLDARRGDVLYEHPVGSQFLHGMQTFSPDGRWVIVSDEDGVTILGT